MVVSITPGNLGVREAFLGFLSMILGHAFDAGVVASGIIRAGGFIAHLLFGSIGIFYFKKKRMM